jgi:phage baseplate assembly protein W
VFEPVHATTLARIQARVQTALVAFEPRILLEEVTVTADAAERNKVLVAITYRVRATNVVQNLVYPFYLQEGAPG